MVFYTLTLQGAPMVMDKAEIKISESSVYMQIKLQQGNKTSTGSTNTHNHPNATKGTNTTTNTGKSSAQGNTHK